MLNFGEVWDAVHEHIQEICAEKLGINKDSVFQADPLDNFSGSNDATYLCTVAVPSESGSADKLTNYDAFDFAEIYFFIGANRNNFRDSLVSSVMLCRKLRNYLLSVDCPLAFSTSENSRPTFQLKLIDNYVTSFVLEIPYEV